MPQSREKPLSRIERSPHRPERPPGRTCVANARMLGLALWLLSLAPSGAYAQIDSEGLSSGSGQHGVYVSAARNVDGDILVAFANQNQDALMLALCESDGPCIDAPTIALDPRAPASAAGLYTQLLRSPDGLPVLVHFKRGPGGGLRVIKCGDPRCGIGSMAGPSHTAVSVPTPAGTVVQASAILDGDGHPIISAYLSANTGPQGLWIIHCSDPACAGTTTQTQINPARPFAGQGSMMVLGQDGFPVVAFQDRDRDGTNGNLAVMKCNDPGCTGQDEQVTVFGRFGLNFNRPVDLTLDAEGSPRIAHMTTTETLALVVCNDPACADGSASSSIIQTEGTIAPAVSIVLDSQQRPLIAVHSPLGRSVQVIACNDVRCVGDDEVTTLLIAPPDPLIKVGDFLDLVADGVAEPLLVYRRSVNLGTFMRLDSLRLERCLTVPCQRVFDDGFEGAQPLR